MRNLSVLVGFPLSLALAAALGATGCDKGDDDDSGTTSSSSSSSSSSSGGTSSSSTSSGGTSSSTSSSGGTSSSTGSSGGTSSSSSGGSTSSSSSSGGGGTVLGGPCDPANATACQDIFASAQCLAQSQEATEGFCGVTDCTVGQANCGGENTKCINIGQPVCLTTCSVGGGDGQCGSGAACVNFNGGAACFALSQAECVSTRTPTGCGAGEVCQDVGTDGFGKCGAGCDLYEQNCADAEGCYPSLSGAPACASTRGAAEGASCEYLNDCAAGMMCVGSNATDGTCHKFCNDTHPCATGTCQTRQGLEGVGVCAA